MPWYVRSFLKTNKKQPTGDFTRRSGRDIGKSHEASKLELEDIESLELGVCRLQHNSFLSLTISKTMLKRYSSTLCDCILTEVESLEELTPAREELKRQRFTPFILLGLSAGVQQFHKV